MLDLSPSPSVLALRKTSDHEVCVSQSVLNVRDSGDTTREYARVLVTCVETITPTGASIEVRYRSMGKLTQVNGSGSFVGSVNRVMGIASISASEAHNRGFIEVTPAALQGRKVGTYLMSRVVQFLHRFPDAIVNPILLSEHQASGENHPRRNRLYQQIGLEFDYYDSNQQSGRSRPIAACNLRIVTSWKSNIREVQVEEHMKEQDAAVASLRYERDNLQQRVDRLEAEVVAHRRSPILWGLRTFLDKNLHLLLPVGLILAGVWALYDRFGGSAG